MGHKLFKSYKIDAFYYTSLQPVKNNTFDTIIVITRGHHEIMGALYAHHNYGQT